MLIRYEYDTRCYFNVRSKADMSRLNLPQRQLKIVKQKKNYKVKTAYARSNRKSLENHVVSPEEEKERLQWEGFVGLLPNRATVVGDDSS